MKNARINKSIFLVGQAKMEFGIFFVWLNEIFKLSLTPGMQTPSFSAYIMSAAKIANQKIIFCNIKAP